jgi:cation diffusion facilitator family transporter
MPPETSGGPVQAAGAAAHGGMRAVLAALAANLGIAATKLAAALITGSASMLAESVHSIADSGNQVLLLVGRRRSKRAETEAHQFGFGTERYFYAFIVAVVLFTVGALFSIYEGWHRITHPEEVVSPLVAVAVLGVAIILESFSLRTALAASKQARGGLSLGHFIRHTKAPELPTVLLEDLAALAGLAFALAGVALSAITKQPVWDGLGSLAIGVLLAVVAIILAVKMKSLLIGEAASEEVEHAIVTALEAGPELQRVIHLRTVHLGPEALLVAAKVAIRRDEIGASIASGIDAAEHRVRAAVPIAQIIYLEPDLYRAAEADATDPAIRAVLRDPAE